jgi:ADP-ribosylation factor-like protein 2
LDNAGKTTIVKTLCGLSIDHIEPTLGFQIHSLDYSSSTDTTISTDTPSFSINLWDIGGQSSIRAYWRNYFEQTDGVIWVVDSVDKSRLSLVKEEFQLILQQEKLVGATLLVLANKQDVQGALTTDQIAEALQLDQIHHDRHWSIQACSAVTKEGLLQGMDWIVQDIGDRIYFC